jgi:hypothetical protein
MKTIDIKSERGGMLVISVLLSFSMFVMGLAFLQSVDFYQKTVDTNISKNIESFYTCAAATKMQKVAISKGDISGDISSNWSLWGKYSDEQNWWRFNVQFASQANQMYGSTRGYLVTGYGKSTYYGSKREYTYTSQRTHIQETFADYLYISDIEEDPVRNEPVRFWTPDTLDGKVHSNDTIRVMGSPRFIKRVTSCAPNIDPPNNNATFDEGFFGNSGPIFFPDAADEIRRYSAMPADFGTFDPQQATEITFDGPFFYVRYAYLDTAGNLTFNVPLIEQGEVFPVPNTGAIYVNGKLFIKAARGTLDLMDGVFPSNGFSGRLTVASTDTMIIPDNLIYLEANADNSVPSDITVCPTVLGLISEQYIMIGKDVNDTVYINAAMAAIHGSITVQDIYAYNDPNNEKESLFIYGSLAQKNRGIVHTTHLGHYAGFIQKDYHYDTRLQKYPPPHFLSTRRHPEIYYETLMGI